MDALFKVQATLEKGGFNRNRAMKLVFSTQENLTDQEMGQLASMHEKLIWLACFHETAKEDEMLEVVKNLPPLVKEKEEKSPSERLRSVLFVLWDQKYKDRYETFNDFYRAKIELIIDEIKSKLV